MSKGRYSAEHGPENSAQCSIDRLDRELRENFAKSIGAIAVESGMITGRLPHNDSYQNQAIRAPFPMDNHLLSLIVPAYNEERTIKAVLDRIFEFLPDVHEVVVVDDASADSTLDVCYAYSIDEPRVKLFRHKTNQGKTAALITGFAACTGTIVVVQDADLEYDPGEIENLIAPIKQGVADVCLGSRFLVHRAGRVLYFRHYLANKFLTFVNNLLTDLNITDVETGYKAARAEIAKNMVIVSSGFGFEIEFVAKCKKIGARIYEVPISYYGRTYEEGKKIGLKDGVDALWYLIKFNILTGLKQSFSSRFLESSTRSGANGARQRLRV
jgi:glycosyltransferase involved in cell wall biosynthesis